MHSKKYLLAFKKCLFISKQNFNIEIIKPLNIIRLLSFFTIFGNGFLKENNLVIFTFTSTVSGVPREMPILHPFYLPSSGIASCVGTTVMVM